MEVMAWMLEMYMGEGVANICGYVGLRFGVWGFGLLNPKSHLNGR